MSNPHGTGTCMFSVHWWFIYSRQWKRTLEEDYTLEERPHLVPRSKQARELTYYLQQLPASHYNLMPGFVFHKSRCELGFRFKTFPSEMISTFLEEMDAAVEKSIMDGFPDKLFVGLETG